MSLYQSACFGGMNLDFLSITTQKGIVYNIKKIQKEYSSKFRIKANERVIALGDNLYGIIDSANLKEIPQLNSQEQQDFIRFLEVVYWGKIIELKKLSANIFFNSYYDVRFNDYPYFLITPDQKKHLIHQAIKEILPNIIAFFHFDLALLDQNFRKKKHTLPFFRFLYLVASVDYPLFDQYLMKLKELIPSSHKLQQLFKFQHKIKLKSKYQLLL